MSQARERNARITSTFLGIEDHGIFAASIQLDYGAAQQAFGNCRVTSETIRKLLEVVGVDCWEKLVGRLVRAKAEHGGVEAIGNIMDEKWITAREFAGERLK